MVALRTSACPVTLVLFLLVSLFPILWGFEFDDVQSRNGRRYDNLIREVGIPEHKFDWDNEKNGVSHTTDLDNMRHLFRIVRIFSLKHNQKGIKELYKLNWSQGKVQKPVPLTSRFPCNLAGTRSQYPPSDVDHLRPGDIDVIASFGDSLSAGNALMGANIIDTLTEFRGTAFSGGGLANWRIFLTLPNILKVFNPQLYGYATSNSMTIHEGSHLNIAEPMLMSRDLAFQARVLIDRMTRDPNVDMQRHWKLLTIFVGNNDFCSESCHHDSVDGWLQKHENDLLRSLRLLRDRVPRLLVNLLSPPNMGREVPRMSDGSLSCELVHRLGCHCIKGDAITPSQIREFTEAFSRWQAIDARVASLPEFQTDTFAVVYQPFISNASFPLNGRGFYDMRYLANDCFHFSQLGSATAANTLWNNMMQPVGRKQTHLTVPFEQFECPSEERPYIATLRNSRSATWRVTSSDVVLSKYKP